MRASPKEFRTSFFNVLALRCAQNNVVVAFALALSFSRKDKGRNRADQHRDQHKDQWPHQPRHRFLGFRHTQAEWRTWVVDHSNLVAVDSRRIRVEEAAGNHASPEAWRSWGTTGRQKPGTSAVHSVAWLDSLACSS